MRAFLTSPLDGSVQFHALATLPPMNGYPVAFGLVGPTADLGA